MLQRRREGTSSVAFEVLIINCQIYFINLFIFNCLTLNIKLFIFKLFDVKFLFSQNHVFLFLFSRTEENGCLWPYERVALVSDFKLTRKMTICYFRDINKFLRYRILCKSILKCGFPTKGIELTQFLLFEVLVVPQLRGTLI